MSLNGFSDEILLEVLSHLGPEDLLFNIAKVCRRWERLTQGVDLWKRVSYNCDRSSEFSRVKQVLTKAPALHSFIIRERGDAPDILKSVLQNPGYLRKLILEHCWLGKDSTDLLANIVDLYPDLEVLSLQSSYPLTSSSYLHIPRLKKLSELNLSYCQGLSGQTLCLIAHSCQYLKKLSLLGWRRSIGNDDIIHVIQTLGEQLTTLVLDGKDLTDVAYLSLNNCGRLQELEVANCDGMSDIGLLQGIGSLCQLTSLRLNGGHNLTAQALATFIRRPSMSSILSLNLAKCSTVDDNCLQGIAERCQHLKELSLCKCCEVTDAGISMIISHCNRLRILNLTGLPSITGKEYLGKVPSRLPHLRQLCLKWCDKVCYDSVIKLLANAPELEVINSEGTIVGAVSY